MLHLQYKFARNILHVNSFNRSFKNVNSILSKRHAHDLSRQNIFFQMLSKTETVAEVQNLLIKYHDFTGLPWWATICSLTVLVRTSIILPMVVHQHYVLAKLELVQHELEKAKTTKIPEELYQISKTENWSKKDVENMITFTTKKKKRELIIRENCHPLKLTVLSLIQLPLWLIISTAIRNTVYMLPVANEKSQLIQNELSCEGFWWISDLTLTDPTWVFPVFLGVCNITITEIHQITKKRQRNKLDTIIVNSVRVLSLILIYVSAHVPSSLLLYWITSSVYGLVQAMAFLCPRVRRFCRIPITPSERPHPFKHIYNRIKGNLMLFSR